MDFVKIYKVKFVIFLNSIKFKINFCLVCKLVNCIILEIKLCSMCSYRGCRRRRRWEL